MTYTTKQVEALCDLYKAIPRSTFYPGTTPLSPEAQLEHGILFMTEEYRPIYVYTSAFNTVCKMYGIDPEEMNATFYKSFKIVTEKTRYELLLDQIIHYCGTYGRESIGKEPITIIPCQDFEIPGVDLSKVKITIIRALSDDKITKLIDETLRTCERPSARIVEAMKVLLPLSSIDLNDIRSFELAVMAYDNSNTVPKNGTMFLRYLVYKTTGETLLIKNKYLINKIKESSGKNCLLTYNLLSKANMAELASIFLRYKPIFLAFKRHDCCAPIINKLRRMADKYHEPLSNEIIQNYVYFALNNNQEVLNKLNNQMSTRDMIKVLNAMNMRINAINGDPLIYNIRNSHSFCIEETYKELTTQERNSLYNKYVFLYNILVKKLEKAVIGKIFYIPSYIEYAVPYSEKQFVNNIPWGSKINFKSKDQSVTIGISWFNQGEERVDLDLHCFDKDRHYGWNSSYYDDGKTIIYSGDITNAPYPNGAAEAFWLPNCDKIVIFTVNNFTCTKEVPFKLYFTNKKITKEDFSKRKYVMNPNELTIPPINLQFHGDEKAMTLGYMYQGLFYFFSGNLSNDRIPIGNYSKYLEAIINRQRNVLNLSNLLYGAGARILRSEERYNKVIKDGYEVVDLSPEKLTATTLIDIIDGKI